MKKGFLIDRRKKDRIVLAALKLHDQRTDAVTESLDELAALSRSAGGEVVATITQARDCIRPGYVFGEGKLQELRQLCNQTGARLVIYDGELGPSQQEKLEEFIDIAVIDRPALILDIFARHARTSEAKTQVELAQLEYLLPRLSGHWTHLERQEAAIGTRGPGETQLETDRRLIQKKIAELKKSLKKIGIDRDTQRKRRINKINFCLVGYTNVGKSSLFNKLSGQRALVAPRFFATIDSTTRRVPAGGKVEYLVTDTVGFIKKLPINLVASFRSTLKEASRADMLIHVVDFSAHDIDEKISTVNKVLADIGAGELKRLVVFNKIDLVNNPDLRLNMLAKYPESRFVSAKTNEGIDMLIKSLSDACANLYTDVVAIVPQLDTKAVALTSKIMQIYSGCVEDGDLIFKGKLLKYEIPKLEKAGVKVEIDGEKS